MPKWKSGRYFFSLGVTIPEKARKDSKWFHPEHYQASLEQVTIRETNQEGKADVDCMVNGYAISFSFKPQWKILKNKRCADGTIFEQVDQSQ